MHCVGYGYVGRAGDGWVGGGFVGGKGIHESLRNCVSDGNVESTLQLLSGSLGSCSLIFLISISLRILICICRWKVVTCPYLYKYILPGVAHGSGLRLLAVFMRNHYHSFIHCFTWQQTLGLFPTLSLSPRSLSPSLSLSLSLSLYHFVCTVNAEIFIGD